MPSIGACCCWGARLALPGFVGGWVRTQGRTCTPASPLTAHHLVFDYASVSLSRGLPRTFWMFPLDSLSLNRHNARLLRWSGFGPAAAGRPWGSGAGVPREGGRAGRFGLACEKGVDIRAGCCRMVGLGCFRLTPGAGFFNSLVGQFEAGACAVGGLCPAAVAALRGRARRKNAAMRRVKSQECEK